MKHTIDTQFYPGWTRKSITFTIDDGNLIMDQKFLDIVRPAGIRGTFNLCSHSANRMTPEEYRTFYEGNEIANHCKYHPQALKDDAKYVISSTPYDPERPAIRVQKEQEAALQNAEVLYPTEDAGLYRITSPKGARYIADGKKYIALIKDSHRELEVIFGEGSIRCFVWPYHQQNNREVLDYLANMDLAYYGVRVSGKWGAEEGYPLPENRLPWHYTATHADLLESAASYEAQPDDGTLKFFCIGVHSIDFERTEKWDDLRTFAGLYGNRPGDYYYAPVGEIFDYVDAVREIAVTENTVTNPSKLDVYLSVDGKQAVLKAGETLVLD